MKICINIKQNYYYVNIGDNEIQYIDKMKLTIDGNTFYENEIIGDINIENPNVKNGVLIKVYFCIDNNWIYHSKFYYFNENNKVSIDDIKEYTGMFYKELKEVVYE